MKRTLIAIMMIVASILCIAGIAFAAGDGNIGQGGGYMGDGTGESRWNTWEEGVRITVVDAETGNRVPGTTTFDWLSFKISSNIQYFHYGNTNKIEYARRTGKQLVPTASTHQWEYNQEMANKIKIIPLSPSANTLEQIRSFFTDEGTLRDIAYDAGISYDRLTNGNYKVLIEPVAFFKFDDAYYLMSGAVNKQPLFSSEFSG